MQRREIVNLVSGGFREYFETRYPSKPSSYFTNGIDQEFIGGQLELNNNSTSGLPGIVYVGNFGEGQGLHSIIPQLAKHFEGRLKFKLPGDGGRKTQLEDVLEAQKVTNVELLPPVTGSNLIEIYQKADVLFLHLNDYDALRKVLPSRIFEYASFGKPIWGGVSGFASEFLHEHVNNVALFTPCNDRQAIDSFGHLELKTQLRKVFVETFSRKSIMKKMAADLSQIAERKVL